MMRVILSWREGQWHDVGDSFTQPDENLVLRTNRHIPCRALRTVWQQNQDKKHGTFIAPLATPEATPCMTRESGIFRGPQEVLTLLPGAGAIRGSVETTSQLPPARSNVLPPPRHPLPRHPPCSPRPQPPPHAHFNSTEYAPLL